LDAVLRYASRVENPNVATPGYGELDLRLGWLATPHLEFSIVGQNLLHDHRGELGVTAVRSEMERSGYAKVAWRY
jgi:iron complex outermembrane receptor protein